MKKVTSYKLLLIVCCLIIWYNKALSQQSMNCDTLLKQEINAENPQQIINNIKKIDCFGLDSIDLKIWGNGPVLGTLLVGYASEHSNKVTYSNLLSEINKQKADSGYLNLREVVIAMTVLEETKATPETWEESKKLLRKIDFSNEEIEKLHQFMLDNENNNWNYRQLVVMYNKKGKLN